MSLNASRGTINPVSAREIQGATDRLNPLRNSELVAWAQSLRQAHPALIAGAKLNELSEEADPFRSPPVAKLNPPFVRPA